MPRNKKYDRIGEMAIATNGMKMTIIAYRRTDDIDVKFENGAIVEHRTYRSFKKGEIYTPHNRVGETKVANNGMRMTIIAYRRADDIDVKFENGAIAEHKTYRSFKQGAIHNPHNRVGETTTANNGMKMTIIAYRAFKDIDVQFEDGTIVTHKPYNNFQVGNIANPSLNMVNQHRQNHIGEVKKNSQGLEMTIIACRKYTDIDVQFEDGVVVQHRQYGGFRRGAIMHPNHHPLARPKIGETSSIINGMKMTIIQYRNCHDIDVQFEDGTIVQHREYKSFKQGTIEHPDFKPQSFKKALQCEGLTVTAKNGLKMTLIKYNHIHDITVQFEDGFTVKNKEYSAFKSKSIKHPFPFVINNVAINKKAYVHNDIGNFYCHCSKCGLDEIMTISEVKEHKCNTRGNNNV